MYYECSVELRKKIRSGSFTTQTSGQAKGCVQANLVILSKEWAFDFLLFAQRNPKPCPIIEVGNVGEYLTKYTAKDADIRTDIPKYRVFKYGKLIEERLDLVDIWQEDFVFFLLGCSFSFEQALLAADLEIRHITEKVNVPMYNTNIICREAGKFKASPMVVSMRPFKAKDAIKAIELTRDYPSVHGSPIHIGNPLEIGIKDISKPDYGDAVKIRKNEVPVFWACGVTPQKAVMIAKPPIMISHVPGHMFVGDIKDKDFKI